MSRRVPPKVFAKPARLKASYVGAPAIFALQLACNEINAAFDGQCYHVGSSLQRPDWRDVDVRLMMADAAFELLFPRAPLHSASWELDPRWLLMTVSISERLSRLTGLPVDFQFQPRAHANERHRGPRNPLGLRIASA